MNKIFVVSIALIGGALLAGMIALNSQFAQYVSPLYASWLAHGTGALAALLILSLMRKSQKRSSTQSLGRAPWWSFAGGLPGAFVVVLAVITVNSPLGLTGTLVLSITGQILFGVVSDQWGLFGLVKRALNARRFTATVLILVGSVLMIHAKGQLA